MDCLDVKQLDCDRLLADWRWLCSEKMTLVARNVFGDLFLRNNAGTIFRLDVGIGGFHQLADSEEQFRELARCERNRDEWFAETEAQNAKSKGLIPDRFQCIGFKVPIVFAEDGTPGNAYVADLYEQVSFLGDLNRQMSRLPEGAKVDLHVKSPKPI